MRSIVSAAAIAALTTMSSIGLAKAAPQPIIPPARPKATIEEKRAIRDRMRLAAIKRERKAERLRRLVASGAMLAA